MMSPTLDTFRLFIHVLAASIWVGGQIALAGIVPALRKNHPESTKTVARAFARVAWTSFAVLVASGMWNLYEADAPSATWDYSLTVIVHVATATAAGAAAVVHTLGRNKLSLALGGALGLVFSLASLFLGVVLRTST